MMDSFAADFVAVEICSRTPDGKGFMLLGSEKFGFDVVMLNPETIAAIAQQETDNKVHCSMIRTTAGKSILVLGTAAELARKLGKGHE